MDEGDGDSSDEEQYGYTELCELYLNADLHALNINFHTINISVHYIVYISMARIHL